MSIETLVILGGIGAVALAWFVLRFGRMIARVLLVGGILAAVIVFGLAMLTNAQATKRAQTTATVATVGAVGASVGVIVLLALLAVVSIGAIGAVAFFWFRWQQAERRQALPDGRDRQRNSGLHIRPQRRRRPIAWRKRRRSKARTLYIVQNGSEPIEINEW